MYVLFGFSFCIWTKHVDGWSPYVDLAYGRPTLQSGETGTNGRKPQGWGGSQLAVDGNDSPDFSENSCTHAPSVSHPFWIVDVGGGEHEQHQEGEEPRSRYYPIKYVMITNRLAAGERLKNFKVIVFEDSARHLCYHFRGEFPAGGTRLLRCADDIRGHSVQIMIAGDSKILSLCQVAVFQEYPGCWEAGKEEPSKPVHVDFTGRDCLDHCKLPHLGEHPACRVGIDGRTQMNKCTIPPCINDFEPVLEWSEWTRCSETCGKDSYRLKQLKRCHRPRYSGTPCPSKAAVGNITEKCVVRKCTLRHGVKLKLKTVKLFARENFPVTLQCNYTVDESFVVTGVRWWKSTQDASSMTKFFEKTWSGGSPHATGSIHTGDGEFLGSAQLPNGVAGYRIFSVRKEDEGRYKCAVEATSGKDDGEVSAEIDLRVSSPLVISLPRETFAYDNTTVKVECRVSSIAKEFPITRVEWFFNGHKTVSYNVRHDRESPDVGGRLKWRFSKTSLTKVESKLFLDQVNQQDLLSNITCAAKAQGDWFANAVSFLYVGGLSNSVTVQPSRVYTKPGASVILPCRYSVESGFMVRSLEWREHPGDSALFKQEWIRDMAIAWWRDNLHFSDSAYHTDFGEFLGNKKKPLGRANLRLFKVRKGGKYSCIMKVRSSTGEDKAYDDDIDVILGNPVFGTISQRAFAPRGSTAKISCQVASHSPRNFLWKIGWFKNEQLIGFYQFDDHGPSWNLKQGQVIDNRIHIEPGRHTCTLHKCGISLLLEDVGYADEKSKFTCYASAQGNWVLELYSRIHVGDESTSVKVEPRALYTRVGPGVDVSIACRYTVLTGYYLDRIEWTRGDSTKIFQQYWRNFSSSVEWFERFRTEPRRANVSSKGTFLGNTVYPNRVAGLKIHNFNEDDAGVYTCLVKLVSSTGQAVEIKDESNVMVRSPVTVSMHSKTHAQKGHTANAQCVVKSDGRNSHGLVHVFWIINGHRVASYIPARSKAMELLETREKHRLGSVIKQMRGDMNNIETTLMVRNAQYEDEQLEIACSARAYLDWDVKAATQLRIDDCTVFGCEHSGKCNRYSSRCACTQNFRGRNCELDVDECRQKPPPCSKMSSCVNVFGSYKCTCNVGYYGNGRTCQANPRCNTQPCKNNGVCFDDPHGFKCLCLKGFTGIRCENRIIKRHEGLPGTEFIYILLAVLGIMFALVLLICLWRKRMRSDGLTHEEAEPWNDELPGPPIVALVGNTCPGLRKSRQSHRHSKRKRWSNDQNINNTELIIQYQ